MKTPALTVSLLLALLGGDICAQTYGPNLVPNPSFEEYEECPHGLGMVAWDGTYNGIYPKGPIQWVNPTYTSPDYYNRCDTFEISGVPYNTFGTQEPYSGDAYIGIDVAGCSIDEFPCPLENVYREYIQIKLLNPMIIGKKYLLSFWANRPEGFNWATNGIGMLLTEFPILNDNSFAIYNNNNQLVATEIIYDTSSWVNVSIEWVADIPAEYLTIGNFYHIDDTEFLLTRIDSTMPSLYSTYYYLDEVVVMEIADTNVEHTFCTAFLPNVITPNGDNINDTFLPLQCNEYKLRIFDRWGKLLHCDGNPWIPNNTIQEGVYYYIVEIKMPDGQEFKRTSSFLLLR